MSIAITGEKYMLLDLISATSKIKRSTLHTNSTLVHGSFDDISVEAMHPEHKDQVNMAGQSLKRCDSTAKQQQGLGKMKNRWNLTKMKNYMSSKVPLIFYCF